MKRSTKKELPMSLGTLRRDRKIPQVVMAERLGIGQAAVSRIEGRDDIKVSTLRDYITNLGGRLVLQAVFDGKQVFIQID